MVYTMYMHGIYRKYGLQMLAGSCRQAPSSARLSLRRRVTGTAGLSGCQWLVERYQSTYYKLPCVISEKSSMISYMMTKCLFVVAQPHSGSAAGPGRPAPAPLPRCGGGRWAPGPPARPAAAAAGELTGWRTPGRHCQLPRSS
jgi:hypothetical protein